MRKGSTDKLLLDITYLLPLLGIDVGLADYSRYFPVLHHYFEIYYSPVSLIEAKWIILKSIKRLRNQRDKIRLLREYRIGLELIQKTPYYKETVISNSIIEETADRLWMMGVKDYFDRMIYATAAYYKAILVTEDHDLIDFYNEDEYTDKPVEVIDWNELVARIKQP